MKNIIGILLAIITILLTLFSVKESYAFQKKSYSKITYVKNPYKNGTDEVAPKLFDYRGIQVSVHIPKNILKTAPERVNDAIDTTLFLSEECFLAASRRNLPFWKDNGVAMFALRVGKSAYDRYLGKNSSKIYCKKSALLTNDLVQQRDECGNKTKETCPDIKGMMIVLPDTDETRNLTGINFIFGFLRPNI